MANFKELEKLSNLRADNNRQKCKYCGHSMTFVPNKEHQICSWCGTVNENHTRARFRYVMYRLMNKEKKIIKLDEENENGKENK